MPTDPDSIDGAVVDAFSRGWHTKLGEQKRRIVTEDYRPDPGEKTRAGLAAALDKLAEIDLHIYGPAPEDILASLRQLHDNAEATLPDWDDVEFRALNSFLYEMAEVLEKRSEVPHPWAAVSAGGMTQAFESEGTYAVGGTVVFVPRHSEVFTDGKHIYMKTEVVEPAATSQ